MSCFGVSFFVCSSLQVNASLKKSYVTVTPRQEEIRDAVNEELVSRLSYGRGVQGGYRDTDCSYIISKILIFLSFTIILDNISDDIIL